MFDTTKYSLGRGRAHDCSWTSFSDLRKNQFMWKFFWCTNKDQVLFALRLVFLLLQAWVFEISSKENTIHWYTQKLHPFLKQVSQTPHWTNMSKLQNSKVSAYPPTCHHFFQAHSVTYLVLLDIIKNIHIFWDVSSFVAISPSLHAFEKTSSSLEGFKLNVWSPWPLDYLDATVHQC
jgi:hypothetical protein